MKAQKRRHLLDNVPGDAQYRQAMVPAYVRRTLGAAARGSGQYNISIRNSRSNHEPDRRPRPRASLTTHPKGNGDSQCRFETSSWSMACAAR